MKPEFIYASARWKETAEMAISVGLRMEKDTDEWRKKITEAGTITQGQKTALEIREKAYNTLFDLYEAANEYIGMLCDQLANDDKNLQIASLKRQLDDLRRENKCMRRMLQDRGVQGHYVEQIIMHHRPHDYFY